MNFDKENKDKGQGLMAVWLDYDAKLASADFHMTEEELSAQLKYQRQREMALPSGATFPQRPAFLENADRFISDIQRV